MAISRPLVDLLACAGCGAPLVHDTSGLTCSQCGVVYGCEDDIPRLRRPSELDERTERVRQFYVQAPFPGYPPQSSLSWLRSRAARSDFARLLDEAIPPDARVLEVGCGTGQMSLFLATAERFVVGADLSRASLRLASDAAHRYGVSRAAFIETDLRSPGLRPGAFDVVYCSGVLHHTPDPRSSFAHLVKLVRPDGFVVLGLYNSYARIPHRLRRAVARLSGYRFVPFDPVLRDRAAEPERREAWLRDQYQHPEEHRHSLREVKRWFRENDVEYVRAYPSSTVGEQAGDPLFSPAPDDWAFEDVLVQLGWTSTWHEGGLFVAIGRVNGA